MTVAVVEEEIEFSAGCVEGALLLFGRSAVGDQRSAFVVESLAYDLVDWPVSRPRGLMEVGDQRAAQEPQVVAMLAQGFAR
jgi:hypothetical protein